MIKKILLICCLTTCVLAFTPICDMIAEQVAGLYLEQNHLNAAYLDAQSAGHYDEMAQIMDEMSDNMYALAALEDASYENGCGHCGGGWTR